MAELCILENLLEMQMWKGKGSRELLAARHSGNEKDGLREHKCGERSEVVQLRQLLPVVLLEIDVGGEVGGFHLEQYFTV